MSTVPYIFANNTGNIPLSQLDANFANVKLSVDYVIQPAQANITSLGTLTALSVSGNVLVSGTTSLTGNITGGNIVTAGLISATSTITSDANITGGNIVTAGSISATSTITSDANITGGNIVTTGVSSRYLDVSVPAYTTVTTTGTYSLSTTNSINILIVSNTGYTATLNMPTAPINGQICNFVVSGNTVTLAVGTGTVLPTFAGSTTAGTGYRYVYRSSNTSWYRTG